jgi:hypothetical protein
VRLAALALALVLAACAPSFTPATEPLPDVTLTATAVDGGTLYRVDTGRPITLYIRFVGDNLRTGAAECTVTSAAVACAVGEVQSFFELVIVGEVHPDLRTFGYACRDSCHPLRLSE